MSERATGRPAEDPRQLALAMGLRPGVTFDNFVPGDNAEGLAAVAALARRVPGPEHVIGAGGNMPFSVWLWGPSASGKSHLLSALCRASHGAGLRSGYLPLASDDALAPDLVQGWGDLDLVCVDDVDAQTGHPRWERALFDLYLRLEAGGGRLVFAAARPPAALDVGLADLHSRLGASLVLPVRPLDDAGRRDALKLHARERGLIVGDEVAEYVLRRVKRDMHTLMATLERLDHAALAAQRRLTVPFVSAALGERHLPEED